MKITIIIIFLCIIAIMIAFGRKKYWEHQHNKTKQKIMEETKNEKRNR